MRFLSSKEIYEKLQKLISAIALSGVMVVPGALAQQVSTDYDHTGNFETHHTLYKVKTANALFQQCVKEIVSR